MGASEHQHILRSYLDKRYCEGALAIDALLEMQAWVTENIKAEHTRVLNLGLVYEHQLERYGRNEGRA